MVSFLWEFVTKIDFLNLVIKIKRQTVTFTEYIVMNPALEKNPMNIETICLKIEWENSSCPINHWHFFYLDTQIYSCLFSAKVLGVARSHSIVFLGAGIAQFYKKLTCVYINIEKTGGRNETCGRWRSAKLKVLTFHRYTYILIYKSRVELVRFLYSIPFSFLLDWCGFKFPEDRYPRYYKYTCNPNPFSLLFSTPVPRPSVSQVLGYGGKKWTS